MGQSYSPIRRMLKSKIHRATVTDADLDYEGSITIDRQLMQAADLIPNEEVWVYDITNGNRFQTYVIPGNEGEGDICLNGAAAHKVRVGDLIIIASYTQMETEKALDFEPKIVKVNGDNRMVCELPGFPSAKGDSLLV